MNNPMIKYVIALILICVGVGMSIKGYGLYTDAQASSDWPTVNGVIKASEVGKQRDITSKSRNKFKYSPNVIYSYEVDGVAYESNRLEFVNTTSKNSMDIREIVANYYPGNAAIVYYDPLEPGSAVLLSGTSWKNYMFLLIGPGLMFGGILAFFIKT